MASLSSRIKNFFTKKKHPVAAYAIQRTMPMVRRGSREVLVAYRHNGWLHSCANLVADGVATPRWRAYKRVTPDGKSAVRDHGLALASFGQRQKALKQLREAGELIEVPDHEILGILVAPNAEFSGRQCMRLVQLYLDLPGEAFLWLQRNEARRVVGFIPIPPHAIINTPTADQEFFTVTYERMQGKLPASEVLWLRHPDPENPHGRGTGLGLGLGDELDSAEFIARSLKATFARGGLPVSVVGVDAGPDGDAEESIQDLESRFQAFQTGPEAQGRPWFTPGKVTIGTLNPDFKSLQTHELQKQLLDFVRMTFNIPPELMGDLSSSNRSTAEAAMYHLAEYALAPRLEFLRAELMHKLVPLIDPAVILEYDDPRPRNFERLQSLMTNSTTAPAFTMNEVRELAGMEPDKTLAGKYLAPAPGTFKPGEEPPAGPPAPAKPPEKRARR